MFQWYDFLIIYHTFIFWAYWVWTSHNKCGWLLSQLLQLINPISTSIQIKCSLICKTNVLQLNAVSFVHKPASFYPDNPCSVPVLIGFSLLKSFFRRMKDSWSFASWRVLWIWSKWTCTKTTKAQNRMHQFTYYLIIHLLSMQEQEAIV